MGHPIRHLPEGGALVEVTCRTLHSRFLLTPNNDLNEIVVGVLARAKRRSIEFERLVEISSFVYP